MEEMKEGKCLGDRRELITPLGVWSSSKTSEMAAT